MKAKHQLFKAADDQGGAPAMFCPNCGKPVKATAEFCGNCGFNLKNYRANQASQNTAQAGSTTQKPTVDASAQPQSRRETNAPVQPRQAGHGLPKWAWTVIVVVVILLAGGYLFGKNYYSRAAQLDRAVTAVKNGNKGVAGYFSSTDPNLKLSDAKLKPLTKHFKAKPAALASFKRQLNRGETNDALFTYQISGKYWLFFDKYTIHVKPLYPTANTNRDGAKITVDGKQVATSNSTSYSKQIGPLVPGNYKIASSGTVSGKKMTNSGTYYVGTTNQQIDLSLRTISFTVETAPETAVYVNDDKVGTTDSNGELEVSDLPWSGNLEVTSKTGSGSSAVTSEASQVTEDGQTVDLEYAGVMSLDDAKNYMDNYWTAIDAMTVSGDASDAVDNNNTDLSDYYVDGANNPQYDVMVKMAKGYYDSDDINSVDYECDVRSVVPTAKDKFTVNYHLTYSFELDDSTHIQEFSYDAHMEKTGSDDYKIIKITGGQKIRDTHEDD